MNVNKVLVTVTLICCLCTILLPSTPVAQARNYLFKTESTLTLDAEPVNLGTVNPGIETTSIITISYEYNRFARPQGFPFPNKKTPTSINITVLDKPSWCKVTLGNESFTADIASFFQAGSVNITSTLMVKIDQDASPFTPGTISLQAFASENGNIQACSDKLDLSLQVEFVPVLEASLSNTSITLKPNEVSNVTITVKNRGNAKITAGVTAENTSTSSYSLILPSAKSIGINEEQEFIIRFQAGATQEEKLVATQTFTITSYAHGHSSLKGIPMEISLSITTLAESADGEDILDFNPYIIVIFLIIAIISILVICVLWRRR